MATLNVILPVFNGSEYISESVGSLLNQTYKDFKLYVIDDGSTDNTLNILSSLKDKRLEIISNETNKGLIYTLNKGLQLAVDCKYIARMDADDISLPNRFAEQTNFLNINPKIGVLGSAMRYISKNGKLQKIAYRPSNNSRILSTFLFYNPMFHPTIMLRNTVLNSMNKYPEEFPKYEDYAFWIELSSKTTFANLNKTLLNYRRHDSNVTNTYKDNINNDLMMNIRLIDKFCSNWDINLLEKDKKTLSIVSYKERHVLFENYGAKELLETLERLTYELPSEFDINYFRNIFFDRCLQYFFNTRNSRELIKFISIYNYDKSFILKYALHGKK